MLFLSDFYHYAIPIINKQPDQTALLLETNNAPYCTPEKMIDQMLGIKSFILQKLLTSEIAISTLTLRTNKETDIETADAVEPEDVEVLFIEIVMGSLMG